jgi:protein-S-isoprenylcysteine O-methyltransferase Ste14
MRIADIIVVLAWIILVAYWLTTATNTKKTTEVARSGGDKYWIISVILIAIAFTIIGPYFAQNNTILAISGTVLVVLGLILAVVSRYTLATNWSKDAALAENQELIKNGPYKHIRHPIYTGFLMMFLGTCFFAARYFELVLLFIFTVFLIVKLRDEEALLEKQFPREYREYKRGTKALIPFIY